MNKKAFTLIEVLVTAVITSIVLAGTAMFITVSNRIASEAILRARLSDFAALVIRDITSDIRMGSVVDIISKQQITIRDQGSIGVTIPPEIFTYDASTLNKLYKKKNSSVVKEYKGFGLKAADVRCRFYNAIDSNNTDAVTYLRVVVKITATGLEGGIKETTEIENMVKCRNMSNL